VAVATGVSTTDVNADLVASGDLDALVIHVGRLCAAGDWAGAWDLRQRCRVAHERGHQLWPIASLVEYRCALDGPGPWVARALEEGSGVWTLGPLPEVAASTHRFADVAPHLEPGPPAEQLARECAARGEDLTTGVDPWRHLLPTGDGVSLRTEPWEPGYPTATYHPADAEFGSPDLPHPDAFAPLRRADGGAAVVDDPAATAALRELTAGWATGWDAGVSARVVAIDGDAHAAIAAVTPGADRLAPLDPAAAMAHLAWAAASGGDTGRRRGLAAGRFDAWWAVAALGGATDDWPLHPDEVGDIATSLAWWVFTDPTAPPGWHLRLAVEDAVDGLSWAIDAGPSVS